MYLSVSKDHRDGYLSRNRHRIINWNRLPDVFVLAEHLCRALPGWSASNVREGLVQTTMNK